MAATPSTPLGAAPFYASLGWPGLPVHGITSALKCTCGHPCKKLKPGKHPRTRHGLKDASVDPRVIREWGRSWPDANYAILCGAASGIVAWDVDTSEGLEELRKLGGLDVPTVTQRTARGWHYLFQHPGGAVAPREAIRPGLDVRGDGSYILIAPSRHLSGAFYRFEPGREPGAIPLAPMTAAMLALLKARGADRKTRKVRGEPVREGARDTTLFHLAVGMNHLGFSEAAIRAALKVENASYIPPLSDSEVSRIIQSALSGDYEPNVRRPSERRIGSDDFPMWAHAVIRSELDPLDKVLLLLVATFDLGDIGQGCTVGELGLAAWARCDPKTLQRSKMRLGPCGRGLLLIQKRLTAWGRLPDVLRVDRVACASLPQKKPKRQKRCLGSDARRNEARSEAKTTQSDKNGVSKESSTSVCVPKA